MISFFLSRKASFDRSACMCGVDECLPPMKKSKEGGFFLLFAQAHKTVEASWSRNQMGCFYLLYRLADLSPFHHHHTQPMSASSTSQCEYSLPCTLLLDVNYLSREWFQRVCVCVHILLSYSNWGIRGFTILTIVERKCHLYRTFPDLLYVELVSVVNRSAKC